MTNKLQKKGNYTYVLIRYDSRALLSEARFSVGSDRMQRSIYIVLGGSVKLKYFASRDQGVEGYYYGQRFDPNTSTWSAPDYYEVVSDLL